MTDEDRRYIRSADRALRLVNSIFCIYRYNDVYVVRINGRDVGYGHTIKELCRETMKGVLLHMGAI